ncbi:MAG: class I SAM-dependent methyltransferase [Bacteroidales bacterium]|nr:class I SAM-dependent methyltransferase [Bacteroidales bacterium]
MELESPLKELYGRDRLSILEAQRAAQVIAFGPISFQASRMMWKLGIFQALSDNPDGINLKQIAEITKLSLYAVKVLVEASLTIGTVILKDGKFFITKTGWYILTDKMTQVNMDFTNDVNYKGFYEIERCLKEGKPEGLKSLGNWSTVYEGLSELEPEVQKSWFAFDHFYSDSSFDEALKIIFERNPKKILDVGGNTGRFALRCTDYNPQVEVTVMDLPQQCKMLKKNVVESKNVNRISTYPADVLSDTKYPEGYDAIWMSQFLDCFSQEQILHIVTNAKQALKPGGRLYIMETFWDRQKYEAASYCLTMTSLYFTVIANGNSKMYHSDDMIQILKSAGYTVENITDNLSFGHSVLECKLQ